MMDCLQPIIWTNDIMMLIGHLRTNFDDFFYKIWIKIEMNQKFYQRNQY